MMKKFLIPISSSIILLLLSIWLVSYGIEQRFYYNNYKFGKKDSEKQPQFPCEFYLFGLQSWRNLDAAEAVRLFRQVVIRDPLYMDAWLKLAEAEIQVGNSQQAQKIAYFCHSRISRVLRWKQSHTLLAHDLGIQDIFRFNLNYLVNRKKWLPDIFFLLDTHTRFQTDRALLLLDNSNRGAFLEYLINWRRPDAAQKVWKAIEADRSVTDELLNKYVDFLIWQKDVLQASKIWRQYGGLSGMANTSFEKTLIQSGFGWRIYDDRRGTQWQCRRVYGQSRKGAHSLRISFFGKENMDWANIYQIVPVNPLNSYQLTYWWKTKGITTDQGPFVEIYSYDAKGLNSRGPMATGSCDWSLVTIPFTSPVDCHAIVVRFRRMESLRFDNKIRGVVWMDDFALTLKPPEDSKIQRINYQ